MGDNGSLLVMENRRHIAVFSFYHQVAGYYFPPTIPGIYLPTSAGRQYFSIDKLIKALSRAGSIESKSLRGD
jgi:hypothetical protein